MCIRDSNNSVIESYDISLVVTPCSVVGVTVSPTPIPVDTQVPDTPEPTPTIPTQAETPLAVTLNGAESDTAVSDWQLWAIVLVAQAGLVALVLRGRANKS